MVPRLQPEQQIRQEEVQTPPRRVPRRNEGHQPRGPRAMTDESVLGPGGLADQQKDTTGRNRQNDEWSPVAALEDTVSRMQRDLEDLQTENRFLRTPRAPMPVPLVPCLSYDRRHLRRQMYPGLMDQPVRNSINKCLMR